MNKRPMLLAMALLCALCLGASALATETADTGPSEMVLTTENSEIVAAQETPPEPAQPEVDEAAAPGETYSITFCDWYGKALYTAHVVPGDLVEMPEEVPHVSGHVFLFWFDAGQEKSEPFDFDSAPQDHLMLFPFYVPEGAEESAMQAEEITVEEKLEQQANDIIRGILGDDWAQAMEGDEGSGMLTADAILQEATLSAGESEADALPQYTPITPEEEKQLILGILGYAPEEVDEMTEPLSPAPQADAEPVVSVTYTYDAPLTQDSRVTVQAHVANAPEGAEISYQWQNDASGIFVDVPGATRKTHTYTVSEYGEAGCSWRAVVDISAGQ